MKNNHLFLVGMILISCQGAVKNENNATDIAQDSLNTKEVEQSSIAGTYGEPFEYEETVATSDVKNLLASQDSIQTTLSGTINSCCQAKGCWMTLAMEDGSELRVTFKDYGFFVPKNSAGHEVVMNGVLKQSETDVATLKHLAEDGGATPEEIALIVAPKLEYKFVANGVEIL